VGNSADRGIHELSAGHGKLAPVPWNYEVVGQTYYEGITTGWL